MTGISNLLFLTIIISINDRPTILLAYDDPTLTNAVTPFLERAGFHVLTVVNGVDALERAQSHRPDLIVLDALMPRMAS